MVDIKCYMAMLELCRRNFYTFCKYMDLEFFSENKVYLKRIANIFQEVYEGTIKKVAISLPPRAGKSYITSLFCAWVLGKDNNNSIMRNSYGSTLAEKFSRDIRDGIIQSDKYRQVFPNTGISKKLGAIDSWALEGYTQPSYFCAGVGGAITGFGCNKIAILDDPIKNIEDALSETIIEKTWDWYTSTHLSRLEKDCANIHIATRWSMRDPIGRLTSPDSEHYDPEYMVVVIPALDKNGESFCEEVKSTREYREIRKLTDDYIWESEFMQNPVEQKGLLFPIEELKRFSLSELQNKKADGVIGYTDVADQGTDYLVSIIGQRFGDYTYITDVVCTQDGVEITEPIVAKLIMDTECKMMTIESNNGGSSFARNVRKIITERKDTMHHGHLVDEKHTTQNKETRILINSGYVKQFFKFRNDYEPGSDYDKYMRLLTKYIKLGKNKQDDAPDATTGLAEFMQESFHIPRVKDVIKTGWYDYTQLEDKGLTKYEINRLPKKEGMYYVS